MGWGKLKIILIAVLLCANLILGYSVIALYRSASFLPDEALAEAAELLAKDNIWLAENAVDTRRPSLSFYRGTMDEEYYSTLAAAGSGCNPTRTYSAPDGILMTMENGDHWAFRSGFYFRYRAADAPESASDVPAEESLALLSGREKRRLGDAVDEYLDRLSPAGGERRTTVLLHGRALYAGRDEESGLWYCVMEQTLKGTPLSGFRLTVTVRDDRVIGVEGKWCFAEPQTPIFAQSVDQINILYNARKRIREAHPAGETVGIVSLTMCYTIYFHTSGGFFYLLPGWQAVTDEGEIYTFNAADGSLYTN